MEKALLEAISRVRRAMPRNQDVTLHSPCNAPCNALPGGCNALHFASTIASPVARGEATQPATGTRWPTSISRMSLADAR
jgi:hypothetical protein